MLGFLFYMGMKWAIFVNHNDEVGESLPLHLPPRRDFRSPTLKTDPHAKRQRNPLPYKKIKRANGLEKLNRIDRIEN